MFLNCYFICWFFFHCPNIPKLCLVKNKPQLITKSLLLQRMRSEVQVWWVLRGQSAGSFILHTVKSHKAMPVCVSSYQWQSQNLVLLDNKFFNIVAKRTSIFLNPPTILLQIENFWWQNISPLRILVFNTSSIVNNYVQPFTSAFSTEALVWHAFQTDLECRMKYN